jgi:hypothetical protein
MLHSEGYYYEGEWKNQKKNGCGRMISKEGDVYEGQWKDNMPEGEGTYEGINPKRKYIGFWAHGYLSGKGKVYYEDESFYEGDFHLNEMHGKGTIRFKNGSIYKGNFRNNQKEGFG